MGHSSCVLGKINNYLGLGSNSKGQAHKIATITNFLYISTDWHQQKALCTYI
jgi:hypothetical protein